MKVKIQIKHWVSGVLLFEFESEGNTLEKTIREANLYGANLHGANLYGANLYGANLCEANLCGADLREANLCEANLCGADLREANLREANLCEANLCGANLCGANLHGANLCEANLCEANLCEANLREANLCEANLCGANLCGAQSSEIALALTTVASEGDVVGWKKCKNNILVKLLIPKEARRSNATGRKCRAEYVQVLEVANSDGSKADEGISNHCESVKYVVGDTVHCDKWNEDRLEECTGGIHFFITKLEAEIYDF